MSFFVWLFLQIGFHSIVIHKCIQNKYKKFLSLPCQVSKLDQTAFLNSALDIQYVHLNNKQQKVKYLSYSIFFINQIKRLII